MIQATPLTAIVADRRPAAAHPHMHAPRPAVAIALAYSVRQPRWRRILRGLAFA